MKITPLLSLYILEDLHIKYFFRIMKISTILLFVFVFQLFATNSNAQSAVINVSNKNLSIGELFEEIESQTDYLVVYSKQDVDVNEEISVLNKKGKVEDYLDEAFGQSDLKIDFENKYIVLAKKDVKINTPVINQSNKAITGTIVDINGEAIIGATVIEKGTTNGTVTDFDGKFHLNILKNEVLQISYIGYISQDIQIKDKTSITVTLKEDIQSLDEVVVVGYGTQKKVNLTGAVETVSSDALENRPIKSVTDALQGAVSGLTVTSSTGAPGAFSSFKVRGNTSINSAGALVIIDGMPGNMNQINPQDIESISVLKDAASSAIYGARAAEGVIVITTKQASSDEVKIEYGGNISFNRPTRMPESNNALDHALLANIAYKNAGLGTQFSQDAINAIKDPTISAIPKGNDWIYTDDVDWISMMFDNSFQQNHNLTISKASDRLKYLFSAGWLDQNGMFSEYGPDNYDRINLRSNVSVDVLKDKLTFDSKISFTNSSKLYHPAYGGWSIPYMTFIQAGPNMPVYDPNGNYSRYRMQGNPIQALQEGGEAKNKQQKIEGIFSLNYKMTKNLVLKAIGGAIIENSQVKEWRRSYGKYGPNGLISMGAGQSGPNKVNQTSTNRQYLTGQLLAEYSKTVKLNEFNILGGWSVEENLYEDLKADRINIIGNELPALSLGATEGWTNAASETEWALMSGFMRANYAYASKYLLEVNFRADASSRFSKNNRWGVFPSASLGWRVTEEKFMKDQLIFSNLKFRASWGQLGNQNGLGLYDHIPQYVVGGYYPFANGLGQWASVTKLASESRTWETVEMKNIAVDMSFLNNKLTVTGEYFIKNNKDMLVAIETPSIIGIDVPTGNYGELEVKGWELSLGWADNLDEFSYSARFNLSDQQDKLVDYGVDYKGFVSGVNKKVQGYSLGSIFGYETDGFFTNEKDLENSAVINKSVTGVGDIKYVDQNSDGKISAPDDLKYLGTTNPRFVFGLNLNASWKGIDLGLLFQGVGKRNFYLNRNVVAPFADTWGNYSYTMHNDYWTPENLDAYLPRHYAGSGHNYQTSDHWLQNAAYLRLKNLQVGYTLDSKITKSFGIQKLRIYFSGENLFEFSKLYKDYDPELTDINGFVYPIMRNFSFGLNVTL